MADRLNLRASTADHTVSIDPPRYARDRLYLTLTPDSPLTYGYEEAGTHLDKQSIGRLLYWLRTGVALPRDDARIPEPFTETPS